MGYRRKMAISRQGWEKATAVPMAEKLIAGSMTEMRRREEGVSGM